jgi:hypothetical protein
MCESWLHSMLFRRSAQLLQTSTGTASCLCIYLFIYVNVDVSGSQRCWVKSKLFVKKQSLTNLKSLSLYLPGENQENRKYRQVQTANLTAQNWKQSRQPITWPISETSLDGQSLGQNLKPVWTANLLANIWNQSGQPVSWPISEASLDSQSLGQYLRMEEKKISSPLPRFKPQLPSGPTFSLQAFSISKYIHTHFKNWKKKVLCTISANGTTEHSTVSLTLLVMTPNSIKWLKTYSVVPRVMSNALPHWSYTVQKEAI